MWLPGSRQTPEDAGWLWDAYRHREPGDGKHRVRAQTRGASAATWLRCLCASDVCTSSGTAGVRGWGMRRFRVTSPAQSPCERSWWACQAAHGRPSAACVWPIRLRRGGATAQQGCMHSDAAALRLCHRRHPPQGSHRPEHPARCHIRSALIHAKQRHSTAHPQAPRYALPDLPAFITTRSPT